MAFKEITLAKMQRDEEQKTMTVTLKQRIYRTADGMAVKHDDTNAAFLVGGIGAKISNITADSLGLIDGDLPENASKERRDKFDKEANKGEDKTGRRSPARGRPINQPPTKEEKIIREIKKMQAEVDADNSLAEQYTTNNLPDANVLSARLGENVSPEERDKAVKEIMDAPKEPELTEKQKKKAEKKEKKKAEKAAKAEKEQEELAVNEKADQETNRDDSEGI